MKNNNKVEPKLQITQIFKVQRSDELLEFLLKKMNTSRNNVKHILANHQVLVNGNPITQFNYPLAKDDEIKISKYPVKAASPTNNKTKERKKPLSISIIYEDSDFIAINKPNGLLSVESDKDNESAYYYVSEYLKAKNPNLRPYVLHRIDKETSGVLVFTKNIKLHSMLRLNWNDYIQTREYIAVVEGKLEKKSDRLVSYLKENSNNMVYISNDRTGQRAVTNYEVLKENINYSLLRVEIETGRKNQIRVEMNNLGHPIVGDDKYGCNKNPLKRLGLHASKLEFIHPITKEVITIVAKTPQIFVGLFQNSK